MSSAWLEIKVIFNHDNIIPYCLLTIEVYTFTYYYSLINKNIKMLFSYYLLCYIVICYTYALTALL